MIRKAVMSDLDALLDIENRAFAGNRLSRRSLRAFLSSPKALMLVLEHAEKTAGYGVLIYRKGSNVARLYSFGVAPDFQGRGLSTPLLEALEAKCAKPIMRLEVRADNAAAIKLYLKMAFEHIGRRDNYYEDGEAALIMEKTLKT